MLRFAFKNMAVKKVQVILICLSIVISASIGVLAFNVASQVDDGITKGAGYYSAIIGPAGSKTQLAMNTMYFTDSVLGTLPYSTVTKLASDSRVKSVIPFAMADNYNGYGVVGSSPALLESKSVAEGKCFSEDGTMEALVGYNVARYNALEIGDVIYTSHSASGDDVHTRGITVVGILDQSHSSYDNIVFTQIKTLWDMHDHGDEEGCGEDCSEDHEHTEEEEHSSEEEEHSHEEEEHSSEEEEHSHEEEEHSHEEEEHSHEEEEHSHEEEEHSSEEHSEEGHTHLHGTVCAILVNTVNPGYAMQIVEEYDGMILTEGDETVTLQAIEPMSVVRDVLNDADNTKYIVFVLCAVILIMNIMIISIITLLNMYHCAKEISLMRLIGISMKKINLLYIIQNGIVGLVSCALAFGLSKLCLFMMNDYVSSMGVVLDITKVYPSELIILGAIFLISILPTMIWTFVMSRKDNISEN